MSTAEWSRSARWLYAVKLPAWPKLIVPAIVGQAIGVSAGRAFSVAGAALGGLLLAAVGPGLVFALNTLSFLPLIVAIRRTPSPYMKPREHVRVSARAAFDHVMAMPTLRAALVRIAFLALLIAPIVQLLPAIAEKLHPGSESYGVLMGVVSAGATVVAFRLAHLRKHLDHEENRHQDGDDAVVLGT